MKKTIYIVNGPNLSYLHIREKEYYKNISLNDIVEQVQSYIINNFKDKLEVKFFQSNSEGEIIDILLNNIDKYDGLIINPAAYSHYSLAIADTLKILQLNGKVICEVHISNIFSRENQRHNIITAQNADIIIAGAGVKSYTLALEYICEKFSL